MKIRLVTEEAASVYGFRARGGWAACCLVDVDFCIGGGSMAKGGKNADRNVLVKACTHLACGRLWGEALSVYTGTPSPISAVRKA